MGRKASSGISVATQNFVEWLDWIESKRSLYLSFFAEDGINSDFRLRDG